MNHVFVLFGCTGSVAVKDLVICFLFLLLSMVRKYS